MEHLFSWIPIAVTKCQAHLWKNWYNPSSTSPSQAPGASEWEWCHWGKHPSSFHGRTAGSIDLRNCHSPDESKNEQVFLWCAWNIINIVQRFSTRETHNLKTTQMRGSEGTRTAFYLKLSQILTSIVKYKYIPMAVSHHVPGILWPVWNSLLTPDGNWQLERKPQYFHYQSRLFLWLLSQ